MLHTRQYPVCIDGQEGAYGATFPDLPGVVAMGESIAETLRNAAEALADAATEAEARGERLPAPSPVDALTRTNDCILLSFIVLAERQPPPPGGAAASR